MNNLILVTGYDSPGKHDASGAFLPEARAFRELHGAGWMEFTSPQPAPKRRRMAEVAIAGTPGLDVLACFGHGTAGSLIVTGHGLANVLELATAIRGSGAKTVVLYACSTAAGRVGFADELAYALPGVLIWAHTSAGHTSWNPNTELAGGPNGGDPVARPGDPLWKRWRMRMHDDQAFRLSFWLVGAVGLDRAGALEAVRGSI